MTHDWIWLSTEVAEAAHAEQLAEHGGRTGVRDAAALENAMSRAQELALRGETYWATLAAAYGFGIVRNQPFIDGNTRTAAVVMEAFMVINGCTLRANDAELVVAIQSLAEGELDEQELADWLVIRPASLNKRRLKR